MDRTREARRVTMAAATATNALSRRRHRSSSLRDSPDDNGPVELEDSARLRERKKDRDRERQRERERERERDRERDRERQRERERDRLSRTSKRRRGDRLISNREDGANDTSEESVNDEDDGDEDGGGTAPGGSVGMLPPKNSSGSLSMSNHHHQHHQYHQHQHRKNFAPPVKVITTTMAGTAMTTTLSTWKAAEEMIGVSVPRKARSASTKRCHEWASTGCGFGVIGGEQIHRQASTSPVSTDVAGMLTSLSPAPAPAPAPAQASPSTSNASMKKKMKPNGAKQMPSKLSSKSSSSAQEEIEIEIAEVLYGLMRQPQVPSKQDVIWNDSVKVKLDSREVNKPNNDAPKRKKPRLVKYENEISTTAPPPIFPAMSNSVSSSTAKVEIDQSALSELVQPEPVKEEKSNLVLDSKSLTEEFESDDVGISKKEESQSPKKESSPSSANSPSSTGLRLDDERENLTVRKANSTVCEIESQREEKFQIDLMAPPSRSSPEMDGQIDSGASDPQPMATDMELSTVKEDDKRLKIVKEDVNAEADDNNKPKPNAEETESRNPVVNKERNIDLQLGLEKSDSDNGIGGVCANKLNHHVQMLQHQQPIIEKTAQSGSLPLPMSMASWPDGLPPMGYMASLQLQSVVSVDGSTVSSAIQPPHLLFTQHRPKRCVTHCYIAWNIHYHQQFMKVNPFWPKAPGSASFYGPTACNLNVVPPSELHGNIPGRDVNSVQDKGQGLATFPGHVGKDKSSQDAANMVDAAQRKQILLQQALPPGAPSNILGPAFIFPLSPQQAAAAVKPPSTGNTASSSTSNSATVIATPAGATAAPTMSINYLNMPGNETQYLAILQNNAYSFPIPAHVGTPPAYRGNHSQPIPFIHGSFYSSQMLHPSQKQQQPPTQLQQSQQCHQNASMSSGSSSSQKYLHNQQQRPNGSGVSGGSGNLQVFPASKNQSPHPLQLPQWQQQPSSHASHQARKLEGELGGEDSPAAADSRVSRANMNIYGQKFAMPLQPPNFALMTAASVGGSASSGGNQREKTQQPSQQPGSKAGVVEPLNSQALAMSFASINGTTVPGLDISSFAQNHAILQSLPESTRQGYQQIMAAAVAAQAQAARQKKNNNHSSEEGKRGANDTSSVEEERKAMAGKLSATLGQSITFSSPHLADSSVSTIPGNNVFDSSARILNVGPAPARTSGSVMPASISGVSVPNAKQQLQQNQQQQQQQQMLQLQKPHQFVTASASRSKTPATSNGTAFSDHHPSSSMAAKFPNALSAFPQNLVQSSGSMAQSPQLKNSVRTITSQVPSPSLTSLTSSSLKNISQKQGRPQQSHTQISFAPNPKATQGQQPPSSTPSPSPPMVVGSPTTSNSRSAGGSPRTTATASTGNKGGHASSLSSQQAKNSPSVPSQNSSYVGGRSVPSVLGNPHISSSNTGTKPQVMLQQQHQKHPVHQAQLFFSNAYMQAHAQRSPSKTANATPAGGYYFPRHRNEQQQTQPPGSSATSATSMLSMCSPVTLANAGTNDPAKAAAAGNRQGGGLASEGLVHAAQFATTQSGKPPQLVPGFQDVHAVPAAVKVKPAVQKQPAGE